MRLAMRISRKMSTGSICSGRLEREAHCFLVLFKIRTVGFGTQHCNILNESVNLWSLGDGVRGDEIQVGFRVCLEDGMDAEGDIEEALRGDGIGCMGQDDLDELRGEFVEGIHPAQKMTRLRRERDV